MTIVLDNVSQKYSEFQHLYPPRKLTNFNLFIVILTYGIPSTVLTKEKLPKDCVNNCVDINCAFVLLAPYYTVIMFLQK